jgi:hypothetical protein
MSKTAVPRSAAMIVFLAASTAAQAQTRESDIPRRIQGAMVGHNPRSEGQSPNGRMGLRGKQSRL